MVNPGVSPLYQHTDLRPAIDMKTVEERSAGVCNLTYWRANQLPPIQPFRKANGL